MTGYKTSNNEGPAVEGSISGPVIVIKGAGDVATGIAHRLYMAHFTRLVMTEISEPLCVRRTVSFSEAVYEGETEVEGIKAVLVDSVELLARVWTAKSVAVMVDPGWEVVGKLNPDIVDAIMAKRNMGDQEGRSGAGNRSRAGGGLRHRPNVHVVVESKRGHDLGRNIWDGSAEAYTGVPGAVMGYGAERGAEVSGSRGW